MSISEGEWEYTYDNDVGPNDDGFEEFYTVHSEHENIARVEKEDDARLMSASPELLEALEGMMQVYGGIKWDTCAVEIELQEMAKKAIAKARGSL